MIVTAKDQAQTKEFADADDSGRNPLVGKGRVANHKF